VELLELNLLIRIKKFIKNTDMLLFQLEVMELTFLKILFYKNTDQIFVIYQPPMETTAKEMD